MEQVRYLVEPLAEGEGTQRERERRATHGLLCRLLEGFDDSPEMAHRESGAPYLPDHPDLWVSVSHCRRAVAVALSWKGPVGIDVECRRRVDEALMERVCTEAELSAVRSDSDPTMAFLRLWTQKEAVLKMRGTGIQGFGSMVKALGGSDFVLMDAEHGVPDVVATLCCAV